MLKIKKLAIKIGLGLGFGLVASGAMAQDLMASAAGSQDQVAAPEVASKAKPNPWMIRLRSIWVEPEVSSTYLSSGAGIKVTDVSNDWEPELDINYFFNPHLSAELILATTTNDVTGTGNYDLGSVKMLPPTVTLLYHFTPEKMFSPYAGAGINYTFFYDADSGSAQDIQYDDTFGFALQAGLDVKVNQKWSVNFDVKKIFLNTDVHVDTGSTMNDSLHVTLNPWIYGVGVGYKF